MLVLVNSGFQLSSVWRVTPKTFSFNSFPAIYLLQNKPFWLTQQNASADRGLALRRPKNVWEKESELYCWLQTHQGLHHTQMAQNEEGSRNNKESFTVKNYSQVLKNKVDIHISRIICIALKCSLSSLCCILQFNITKHIKLKTTVSWHWQDSIDRSRCICVLLSDNAKIAKCTLNRRTRWTHDLADSASGGRLQRAPRRWRRNAYSREIMTGASTGSWRRHRLRERQRRRPGAVGHIRKSFPRPVVGITLKAIDYFVKLEWLGAGRR